ncbi:oligopeptidase B [Lutibacter oricola]|uniref:Proline-specific endopeptidase n=1 Tax=Lutibacter oricola TaxID=762486 RepID=A0A1H2VTR2_9FLAO|nr:S9 family peptidase [Lutibacter oricola]SDW71748.1 oligopeptidase B [Lutibacter oricola]
MTNKTLTIPSVEKIEKRLEIHGDVRIDNYYWLNEKENPKVIDYLNAENDYFEAETAHTKEFQELLFTELKSRIKEDDESVPYKKNGYFYVTRFEKGKQYPIHTRKFKSLDAEEQILFDINDMAKDYSYFNLSGVSVSPNNKLAAFGTDTVSRRQYTLQFKNLETGELYPEKIENTTGSAAWANDNKTVFYTQKNPTTLRSEKIFRHVLGTSVEEDVEIFSESDEAFGVYVYRTKSEKYLMIGAYSTVSTEYSFLNADDAYGDFKIFQQRERDLEYSVSHYNDHFYILTNKDKATNFKLMKTLESKTSKENWEDVIAHREDVLLEDFSTFKNFLVLEERIKGVCKIRIKRWDNSEDFFIPFNEETYSAGVYYNPEFDTNVIRYGYNSMTTPSSVIDFNVDTKTEIILKEQQVLGGKFDKDNYISERIWATANDGTEIPISLVYNKNTQLNKNTPLLLYGYGSYGHTIDAGFSSTRLSLLDRGFVFAIAHVRGSEYLGRKWYENGKLLNKVNTFSDFIDCAKFLVEKNYTSSNHLYASGGSAGGLLMGAVVNMEPSLFNGIIAAVPFVDVVTTMLDDTIPLTTGEYDEWGNPNEEEYYNYMKSYSPYDNVQKQEYPNMLVTTGLHDSQVQYFEPAKWVAKLRELKTNNKLLVMHTDMETGHGGASGRFDALKEIARDYSFILDLEGKANN